MGKPQWFRHQHFGKFPLLLSGGKKSGRTWKSLEVLTDLSTIQEEEGRARSKEQEDRRQEQEQERLAFPSIEHVEETGSRRSRRSSDSDSLNSSYKVTSFSHVRLCPSPSFGSVLSPKPKNNCSTSLRLSVLHIVPLLFEGTCWSSHSVNHFFGSSGAKD